ncbi:MAG: RNA methyltransferase [Candidatus Kariarchaeaceae archaeon]
MSSDRSNFGMNFVIVAVGLKHSGNLGAIARICDNFNTSHLILVAPECVVDDRAYERATKARRYLDSIIIRKNLSEVREYADVLIALSARTGGIDNLSRSAIPIQKLPMMVKQSSGVIALVLGRENYGLTNEEVNECDILTTIPIPGSNPVLNVSHAITIVLWEFFRNLDESEIETHRLMRRVERKAFFTYLNDILEHAWIRKEKHSGINRVFSSVLGRAFINQREANALIGTLRGIYRSLNESHPPWDDCNAE